jgi:Tfp pilus assembly PilM family ATPase
VEAIRRVLRENNITAKKVTIALPGKDVLIRYFQIARIPKSEWEGAIKFEAKKYIPFKIEELLWDFCVVLHKDNAINMSVTFAAVKEQIAKKHLSLFEEAGLKVSTLEPAPFSMVRLFTLGKQLVKEKPTVIIDVDFGMADINIVKDKICYLTRDVSLPLEEDLIFDNLINEIRMSMDYYEKLFPAEIIGNILLCGEVELKDWDKNLAEELKVPVEKLNLGKTIKIGKVLPPLNIAIAIGLALRGLVKTAADINLYRIRKAERKVPAGKKALEFTPEMRQAVFRAVILSCIGLLILYLAMQHFVGQEKEKLEQAISLRPKISIPISSFSFSEVEQTREELTKKVFSLASIIDERTLWTPKFNELPKMTPPGLWLTELNISESLLKDNKVSRFLSIKGMAYDEDPVREIGMITKFVSNLKENESFSRDFRQIKLDSMASGKMEGRPVKIFSISCVKR